MSTSRMGRYREAKDEIFIPFWVPGWNLIYTIVGIAITTGFLGYQVGLTSFFGFIGIAVAPLTWYAGTRYVEANYESVLEAFFEDVTNYAEITANSLDTETSRYTFDSEWDSRLLLTPVAHYRTVMVIVGETALVPLEMTLHLNLLNAEFPRDPPVIVYEDIVGLDYEDSTLIIETRSEDYADVELPIDESPTELISAVRERVEAASGEEGPAEADQKAPVRPAADGQTVVPEDEPAEEN